MTPRMMHWVSVGFVLLAFAFLAVVVFSVHGLGRLLIIAALLAYVLQPLVSWLECAGLDRATATGVVFLVLGGLLVSLTMLVYPVFTAQLQALQSGEYAAQATAVLNRLETGIREKFFFLGLDNLQLTEEVEKLRRELGKALSKFLITDLVPSVAHLVAIPFISFFLLKDGRKIKKQLIGLVPNRYFECSLDVIYKMDLALGNFLRGQFLDGLFVGVLTTLAMWLLNVKYSLLIGIFAGLANLIPYVGPLAGAMLAVTVVLLTTGDPAKVAVVLAAFLLVKLLDDAVIQPLTVSKSVKMHPLLVVLVIIIGGHYFGILGMLLAVPVTGFLKVAFDSGSALYRKYRFTLLTQASPAAPGPAQ